MGKWFGTIGYGTTEEVRPGVWKDSIMKRNYSGDVIRNNSRWSTSPDSTNDDLNVNNQISILADPFARDNFHSIKFIEFMGTNWKVTSVDVQYPRLILTIGGVYNGQQT